MLVDSHCHLDYPEFTDIGETVRRAEEAGVGAMLTIGTELSRFPGVLAVAESPQSQGKIYCTVGVHPHEAGKGDMVVLDELLRLAEHPKVVGFGETGLDYFYDHSPRAEQRESFRIHIEAARQMQLPLIVHTRDAEDDTLEILSDEMKKGDFPGLIHCFSASESFARQALEMGLYISISGIVTFKKADELRDAIKNVPLERLLVETDAPYLAPVPFRGKPNEPAYTRYTAEKLTEIINVSFEELEQATTDNFYRLFSKAQRPAHMAKSAQEVA